MSICLSACPSIRPSITKTPQPLRISLSAIMPISHPPSGIVPIGRYIHRLSDLLLWLLSHFGLFHWIYRFDIRCISLEFLVILSNRTYVLQLYVQSPAKNKDQVYFFRIPYDSEQLDICFATVCPAKNKDQVYFFRIPYDFEQSDICFVTVQSVPKKVCNLHFFWDTLYVQSPAKNKDQVYFFRIPYDSEQSDICFATICPILILKSLV